MQVFKTAPTKPIGVKENHYVFENDTVLIVYGFWLEKGIMSFSVYNKLQIPLYIDWRKSAYVNNEQKFDYWYDVEKVETQQYSASTGISKSVFVPGFQVPGSLTGNWYNINASQGVVYGTALKTKPERITFIAPNTSITKVQYEIYENGVYLAEGKTKFFEARKTYSSDSLKEPIAYMDMSPSESVVNFGNFLTLSTSEQFTNEFYMNHTFYVNRIITMRHKQFENEKSGNSYYNETAFFRLVGQQPALNREFKKYKRKQKN